MDWGDKVRKFASEEVDQTSAFRQPQLCVSPVLGHEGGDTRNTQSVRLGVKGGAALH